MAEICFRGDKVWFCSFPLMVSSIADLEEEFGCVCFLKTWRTTSNPIEIFLAVVDHFFG